MSLRVAAFRDPGCRVFTTRPPRPSRGRGGGARRRLAVLSCSLVPATGGSSPSCSLAPAATRFGLLRFERRRVHRGQSPVAAAARNVWSSSLLFCSLALSRLAAAFAFLGCCVSSDDVAARGRAAVAAAPRGWRSRPTAAAARELEKFLPSDQAHADDRSGACRSPRARSFVVATGSAPHLPGAYFARPRAHVALKKQRMFYWLALKGLIMRENLRELSIQRASVAKLLRVAN